MAYCLPTASVKRFIAALKDGTITPDKLADASSSELRRELLEPIVGADDAKELNTQIEQKLLLKDQNRGLASWAKKTAGLSDKTRTDIVEKAGKMNALLDEAGKHSFLSDLAEKKVGTSVSAEELQKIIDLSKKASDLRDANAKMSGVSDDYLKAREELRDYIASRKPISAASSISKNIFTIMRNNLLMNPATPLKTTLSQVVNSGMDMITRRLASFSLKGDNYDLAQKANAEAWDTFRNTGLNTASMESMDDTGRLGEKNRFETPSGKDASGKMVNAIESATRKVAEASNKIAIDWEHNISFTKFYQKAFFDGANVISSMIAKGEKLSGDAAKSRSGDIFTDAARIEPKTPEGALVRMEAQKQAARVTSTNETLMARFSLGIKDAFNKAIPGLGNALVPIAKIPANIIWNGIENAGVGIPLGLKDIWEGRLKTQSDNLSTRYQGMAQFAGGIQKVARTIGVMSAAAYFSSQLSKSDFRQDKYGNNFVKIGNIWINMEYMSAISPALAGMMNVRQKSVSGQGVGNTLNQYVAGAWTGLRNTPGIDEANKLVTDLTNSNYAQGIQKYASQFFSSRGTPQFIQNLLKNRPIERLFFGATGVETQEEVNQDKETAARKSAQSRKNK